MPGSPELTSLWRPLRVSSFRNLIISDVHDRAYLGSDSRKRPSDPYTAALAMQKKPTTQLGRSCIQAVDRHMNTLRRHKQHRTKNSLRDVILGGQDGLVIMLGIALGV